MGESQKIVDFHEQYAARHGLGFTRLTTDGKIIRLVFAPKYPSIAPAKEFIGTTTFEFLTKSKSKEMLAIFRDVKNSPKPGKIKFDVHWKGKSVKRIGYIYSISKNEVSMIQTPRGVYA